MKRQAEVLEGEHVQAAKRRRRECSEPAPALNDSVDEAMVVDDVDEEAVSSWLVPVQSEREKDVDEEAVSSWLVPVQSEPTPTCQITPPQKPESAQSETKILSSPRDATSMPAVKDDYEAWLGVSAIAALQQRIAAWLFQSHDHNATQKDTYNKAAPGTGEWFLRSQIFEEWISKESGTLWGTGMPGTGKTFLVSAIINHLATRVIPRSSVDSTSKMDVVAYVYCRSKDKLSTSQVLASILAHLVQCNQDVANHVEAALYHPCSQTSRRPTNAEILDELRHGLSLFSRTFIVVDALNEISHDVCQELVLVLTSLNCHLLLTSRDVSPKAVPQPNFTIRTPYADFRSFVMYELLRSTTIRFTHKEVRKILRQATNEIARKSHRLFPLAILQVAALSGITTPWDLHAAISEPPRPPRIASQILLKCTNEQTQEESGLAYRAILWATHAVRPMKMDEFLVAVSMSPDLDFGEPDLEAIPNEDAVLAACCGFITINKDDRIVRFVNPFIRDFFQLGFFQSPHTYMAAACATYLCRSDIKIPPNLHSHRQLQKFAEPRPFFEYATLNLGLHIQKLSPEVTEQIPRTVQRYLDTNPSLVLQDTDYPEKLDLCSATHVGAFYGITPLIDLSLDGLFKLSQRGNNSLFYACKSGSLSSVAHILYRSGPTVDINTRNQWEWTALHYACMKGHMKRYIRIIRLLLNHPGIEVNIRDRKGFTALRAAMEPGSEKVVRLLLEQPNLEVNARDKNGSTALMYASAKGYTDIVQLLLRKSGIDINGQNQDGHTALCMAAQAGHTQIVRLLLEQPGLERVDIEVNVKGKKGFTALIYASAMGYEEIVQSLLGRTDIDINARNQDGCTALCMAAGAGHTQIIRLLLKHPNLKVNVKDRNGLTALAIASAERKGEIVRLLLNYPGIDPNIQDANGRTALFIASENGSIDIVQLLVQHGDIMVDITDIYGHTAFDYTKPRGFVEVLRLLRR